MSERYNKNDLVNLFGYLPNIPDQKKTELLRLLQDISDLHKGSMLIYRNMPSNSLVEVEKQIDAYNRKIGAIITEAFMGLS